jgi:hypothetical protein
MGGRREGVLDHGLRGRHGNFFDIGWQAASNLMGRGDRQARGSKPWYNATSAVPKKHLDFGNWCATFVQHGREGHSKMYLAGLSLFLSPNL